MPPTLTVLGAAREVTGSAYLVQAGGTRFLVDFGLHQGNTEAAEKNLLPFPFDPAEIDFLILTHAHIDHSGLIPRLVAEGFQGAIHATAATADLAAVMLRDSAHIQEMDAEWRTRKAKRAGRKPWRPAYTREDADRAIGQFQSHDYGEDVNLGPEVRLRFWDAGHILGSAILELTLLPAGSKEAPVHLVFSGDVGQPEKPLIRDPESGMRADYLVLESTYGGRRHEETKDAIEELRGIIKAAKSSGGNIIIPSFAVGRTQEIIYYLRQICEEEKCDLPIYVDSPLAKEATEVYRRHRDVFDEEARAMIADNGPIFRFAELHFTESADESRALNGRRGVVIISASGMAEAGRIKHHLKHNLWRPEAHVVFVGYQAQHTLGRRILEGSDPVRIFGEEIAVRAHIHDLTGFSAHADEEQLVEWASQIAKPRLTLLTHGEPEAAFALQRVLESRLGFKVAVPKPGERFTLS